MNLGKFDTQLFKMKKLFIYILFVFGSNVIAQNELNNQIIWGSGTFYPEQISDVISMNDGKHFTSLDINYNNGSEIDVQQNLWNSTLQNENDGCCIG